jgi:hypothetical protein
LCAACNREKDDSDRNLVLVRTKKGIARTSVPPTSSPAEVIKSLKCVLALLTGPLLLAALLSIVKRSFDAVRRYRSHTPVLANAKFSKVKDLALNTDLLDMERKMIAKNYKFGILYVKEGQTKENEMFANGTHISDLHLHLHLHLSSSATPQNKTQRATVRGVECIMHC